MGYKGFRTDERVVVTVVDLLKDRVDKIKYKKGFSNRDITADHGTTTVYAKVLFKLLELMILDVIEGHIVYFNKRVKARFYVDYTPAGKNLIMGKGIKKDMKIPLVDFKVTRYRMPLIAFDPGYRRATPCQVYVPSYLYSLLVEKINAGKKYTKSTKDFWFNRKR